MVLRRRRRAGYSPIASNDDDMDFGTVAGASLFGACASAFIGQWCCPKAFKDNWNTCREASATSEETVALRIDQLNEAHASNIELLTSEIQGMKEMIVPKETLLTKETFEEMIVPLEEMIAPKADFYALQQDVAKILQCLQTSGLLVEARK